MAAQKLNRDSLNKRNKPLIQDGDSSDNIKAQIDADNLGTNVLGCFNRSAYMQGPPGAIR